jgi:hypothetical protein
MNRNVMAIITTIELLSAIIGLVRMMKKEKQKRALLSKSCYGTQWYSRLPISPTTGSECHGLETLRLTPKY